jgi:hypothetical protein
MKRFVLLLMVVGLVCAVNAANLRYKGNGPWQDVEGVDGVSGHGWQGGALPGTLDTARANWGGATITLDYAAPTINKFELGVDESGGFHILSGGNLTTLSDSRVGHNGGAGVVGTLTIDLGGQVNVGSWLGIGHNGTGIAIVEGTLSTNSHLWMGAGGSGGNGTLTINNGGVVNVGGNIGLGTINASTPSGGTAVINVNDGGLLNLYQWSATTSIMDGSVLNINGTGTVIIGGNRVGQAYDYFGLGKIASDLGAIDAIYTAEGDFTTITAIPEPATMVLLGLGALGLLRKKK